MKIRNWVELVDTIKFMLNMKECKFATETLVGIKNNVTQHERMTDKQRKAVENILKVAMKNVGQKAIQNLDGGWA